MMVKSNQAQHYDKVVASSATPYKDSGASIHIINANAVEDGNIVKDDHTINKTAKAGDTMYTSTSANIGVMERVRIMEGNELGINLASVSTLDKKAGYTIVFANAQGSVYGSDGNSIHHSGRTYD